MEARRRLASDPHRPLYHFLPPANWMNDPNGLIQWQGRYHMFYQHNPAGPLWGTIHWGHAVSDDLVHWNDLPIALSPTPGGPDKDGCWSGCAVDDDGIPTLIYTGVFPERPCVATSRDNLLTWEKYAGNPVIAGPPEGLDVLGFRDHCVWREGDTWYQLVGSGIRGVGGTALLYRSRDLVRWSYVHPLCVGDSEGARQMWECPDFFPLDDRYCLLVSGQPEFLHTYCFLGAYADHTFTPETQGLTDFGLYFYAAQTLLDDLGRRIVWGWIKEGRSGEAQQAAGWAGVMSLPRLLSLRSDGLLGMTPAPELEALRGRHHRFTNVHLTPTSSDVLGDVKGDCLEILIVAEFGPGGAGRFGLKVRCSPDGEEQTLIIYDREVGCLAVDRERSSLDPEVSRGVQEGPLELDDDECLRLRVFLDRSVIEIFANDRACLTDRIYPARADSLGLDLFSHGGSVMLNTVDIWEMGAIWPSSDRAKEER